MSFFCNLQAFAMHSLAEAIFNVPGKTVGNILSNIRIKG